MGGGGAREIDGVATHSDADMVYFGLGGSNGGHHLDVGDFAVMVMEGLVTNKTVLVPVGMRLPTPWARRPKSLARALTQVVPSGPRMRC